MDQNPSILIVDDDLRMAKSVRAILDGRGYDIQIMDNPCEALAEINQAKFDLVLLDITMPVMTGFELLKALDRETMDTLFIVLTGDASMESATEAIRKGASDYLKKPFDPDELIIRVDNVMKQIELKHRSRQAEEENRNLAIQLQQSQKMEAIGTMAGGIAHDFNNILTIMMGNTELAIAGLGTSNPVRPNIEKILVAGDRAKEMISRLLSFSRMKDSEQVPIKLNTIIIDTLELLRASIPASIDIQHRISRTPYTVLGDTTQIHQIMINLCTNAAHAMQESGGTLSVSLSSIVIDENSPPESKGLEKGEYVRLIVADTGHGIDPEVQTHIFEPYFTTKDVGEGTGMGLAVAYGIVKKHEGEIRVFSEIGVKTEFHVYLPTIDTDLSEPKALSATEIPKGSESILLIDDEEMVLDMMKQTLEQFGYQVTAYTDSLAALSVFRTLPDGFDLVITDMTMPDMAGDRLSEEIKAIRKDIPIILCTGLNNQANCSESEDSPIQAIISKPVRLANLTRIVRETIDRNLRERRKYQRYALAESTFVISSSNPHKQGQIIDISKSGLSFKCPKNGNLSEQFERLSIKTQDESFVIEGICYEMVSDVDAENSPRSSSTTTRRLGGRFERLSPLQNNQLDRFIKQSALDVNA